ncbi:hypothetical protein QCA50_002660 [Cerrena zonata]|uniref:F-box domain-containing protein n=1 Tax=Cerrena zonata TaxID=2478898 RepID=A0AAW0GPX7_9APHY
MDVDSFDDFPDIVQPGTCFSTEDVQARIAEHNAGIEKHKAAIIHHERAIARLRGCLNVVTPSINKLFPTEILREIFLYYHALHFYNIVSSPSTCLSVYKWLRVSHVCRMWRAIILKTPSLFTHIHVRTYHSHWKEFLRLSQLRSPFHVQVSSDLATGWEESGLPLALIRTLIVRKKPSQTVWPYFSALTFLTCTPQTLGDAMKSWFDDDFDDNMPNLKYFDVYTGILGQNWLETRLPPTIQTLILSHSLTIMHLSVEEIIEALSRLLHLENLCLTGSLDQYTTPPNHPDEILQLRPLRHLKLSSDPMFATTFLHHLSSIDHVEIALMQPGDINALFLVLQEKLSPLSPNVTGLTSVFSLNIDDGMEPFIMELNTTGTRERDIFPGTPSNTDIRLSVVLPRDWGPFVDSLTNNLSSRLLRVTRCRLSLHRPGNKIDSRYSSPLRTLLGGLPGVEFVEVDLYYRNTIITAAFPKLLAVSSTDEDAVLLPNLRDLKINLDEDIFENERETLDTSFVNLIAALDSRKAVGLYFNTVTIDASKVHPREWHNPHHSIDRLVPQLQDVAADVVVIVPPQVAC